MFWFSLIIFTLSFALPFSSVAIASGVAIVLAAGSKSTRWNESLAMALAAALAWSAWAKVADRKHAGLISKRLASLFGLSIPPAWIFLQALWMGIGVFLVAQAIHSWRHPGVRPVKSL